MQHLQHSAIIGDPSSDPGHYFRKVPTTVAAKTPPVISILPEMELFTARIPARPVIPWQWICPYYSDLLLLNAAVPPAVSQSGLP